MMWKSNFSLIRYGIITIKSKIAVLENVMEMELGTLRRDIENLELCESDNHSGMTPQSIDKIMEFKLNFMIPLLHEYEEKIDNIFIDNIRHHRKCSRYQLKNQ